MPDNPHFEFPDSWAEAAKLVPFEPIAHDEIRGHRLRSLAVFVRDHEHREVAPGERALEAHYDGFVLSQSRPGTEAAHQRAYDTSYGRDSRDGDIDARGVRRRARVYDLGPEPEPDDPDPRMPAVVAWADGERFHLLASEQMEAEGLIAIGRALYGGSGRD